MGYLPFQESDQIDEDDDEGTYVTAPTSPIITAAAAEEEEEEEEGSMALFYSLPSSPMKRTLRRNLSSFVVEDDFEFETSKKFRLQSAELEKTLCFIQQQQQQNNNKKNQNLVLPEIAFADELFSNGVVMVPSPLKLPPGRVPPTAANTTQSSSFSEIGGHPSCLRAVGGSPWRHTWKDGFDPFAAAIQKIVKEEVRKEESPATVGKSEQKIRGHRRAHSLCIPPSLIHPHPSPKSSGVKEKKHERTESDGHANLLMQKSNKDNPSVPSSPGSVLNTQNGFNEVNGPSGLNWRVTSRKQGMGKFLRRYATFKTEKNEGKIKDQIASLWRSSSFKRMSLRFKESRHSRGFSQDEKKETKMAIPNYQPKFATCLGIGGRRSSSPT